MKAELGRPLQTLTLGTALIPEGLSEFCSLPQQGLDELGGPSQTQPVCDSWIIIAACADRPEIVQLEVLKVAHGK